MPTEIPVKTNENKKMILIIASIAVLVILGLIYFFWVKPSKEQEQPTSSRQKTIEEQTKELDELNKLMGYQPLTDEEVESQSEELEKLNQKAGYKPLTEEEIKKQTEELEKLRSQ